MWALSSTFAGMATPANFACQGVSVLTSPYPQVEFAPGKFVRFR